MNGDSSDISQQTMKILVIDDDELLLETIGLILESRGIDVLPAAKGTQAIAIYLQMWESIDAVVSDWRLPGLDGIDVFHAVKAINPDVRFFLISGYVDSAVKSQALSAGIKGFVQKPFRPQEIPDIIRKVMTEESRAK